MVRGLSIAAGWAGTCLARRGRVGTARRPSFRRLACETLEDRRLLSITSGEQEFVYLVNRARHDPVAYQEERSLSVDLSYVTPRGPLAASDNLFASSGFHAEEMAQYNYVGHQSQVTGDWPNKMARDHGYVLPSYWSDDANYIESIAGGTFLDTAAETLDLLVVDAGVPSLGHRNHLLGIDSFNADNREIGVGYAHNAAATYSNYWAIHATRTDPSDTFLTGVVYNDLNGNLRYEAGEGLAGVTVAAGALSATTNAAGGWSIQVAPGGYTVTASGAGFAGTATATATVAGENVEVDFLSGQTWGIVDFDDSAGPPPEPDTVGLYDPLGRFHIKNSLGSGLPDQSFYFGPGTDAGWQAISGDWDGDGADSIALYDPNGKFHVKNALGSGLPDVSFYFGLGPDDGWQAIAGDWDGDGVDTIGLYDPLGRFHVKNSLSGGNPDQSFYWGPGTTAGWQAIAGDWDGDGDDTIGLYDTLGRFHVINTLGGGMPDQSFYWGPGASQGWEALVGDWDGDGDDTVGLYDTVGRFHVKNTLASGMPDQSFYWGPGTTQNWRPLTGNWDGPGGSALRAAGQAVGPALPSALLTDADVQVVLDEALAAWTERADAPQRAALADVTFVVTHLSGDLLGLTVGKTIYLDADAAGHGWFVDLTPGEDGEFSLGADGSLRALDPEAVDKIDLLTVVEHELGHVLGLEDLDGSADLMNGTLEAGVRRQEI